MLIFTLLACAGPGETDADTSPTDPWADHPVLVDTPLVIAHRGGALLAPEETTVAFDHAVAVGAHMLEVDVWSTSDGELVLMHDSSVDRTTDGTGEVSAMSWAELSALDAGYRFTVDGETFPWRGQGVKVARLEDALASYPDLLFSIEIKQQSPSIAAQVLELVDAAGLHDRVVIGSFDPGPIAEIRAADPTVLTGLTVGEGLALYGLTEADEAIYEPPARLFAAPTELGGIVLDAATIAKAKRVGVTVQVWTVNERAEMERVIDMGGLGIITDDPATLRDVFVQRGLL